MTTQPSITSMYEGYGALARTNPPPLVQAARYAIQAEAERLVVPDVESKLALAPDNSLLEIGCGPGNLLIPLSFRVARAIGIDHPDVTALARARFLDARVEFVAGCFPGASTEGPIDRVLVYAVLHYLPDMPAIFALLDAAVALLAPAGRLLLGDLPNSDRKRRFMSSPAGRAFEVEWQRRRADEIAKGPDPLSAIQGLPCVSSFDDATIMELVHRYRQQGFHVYVLPQPPELPFGHTREDILIVRP